MKLKLTRKLYRQFMSNVKVTKGNCWLWKGGKAGGGYGLLSVEGIKYRTHRLAVTLFLDPNYDPVGRGRSGKSDFVLHDCDVKNCVSPYCINIGTAKQNIIDAYARNRIDRAKISKALMGHKASAAARARMSKSASKALIGHTVSDVTRAKISKTLIGHAVSVVTRAKISKTHTGLKHSAETRAKMRKTQKLRRAREAL